MKNFIKNIIKLLILFLIGGTSYWCLEVLYRGWSHPSMFVLGGICFVLVGLINEFLPWDMYIEVQDIIGTTCVVVLEFITGCIVNLWLGLDVWTYEGLPGNILGQICLPFTLIWVILVLCCIIIDDAIRYVWFKEEKPRYKSFIVEKIKKLFKR